MIKIAYSTISYGSSGSDVKKLQQALNDKGYALQVDGQFGAKTQAAVKDYQKKNGLQVDGIVGNKTWGSLTSGANSTKATSTAVKPQATATGLTTTPRPEYEKSQAVQSAENALSQWESNKPDQYESKYSAEIEALLSDILNREEFSYNMNADPMYQQYRQQYVENGKKAMMDTVGQATALTGGYGSSYAVTAGNEAYDEYLNALNDVALDLRDRAYLQYTDKGDKMLEDITLLRSLEGDDYNKYLGQLENYYADGEYLLNKLTSMSDAEFEAFLAEVDQWESDRDYDFKRYQDDLDRQEFDEEMAFKKSEAERQQANADREYALAVKKASSSGGSGGSSSSSSTEKNGKADSNLTTPPITYNEFVARTGVYTILTAKEFGSSRLAETYYTYQDYLAAMYKKYKKG